MAQATEGPPSAQSGGPSEETDHVSEPTVTPEALAAAEAYLALPQHLRDGYRRSLSDWILAGGDFWRGVRELGGDIPPETIDYLKERSKADAEARAAHERMVERHAQDYERAHEARERAKRRIAEKEAAERGLTNTWARIDPVQALEAASVAREPEVGRFAQTTTDPPHGAFYRGCINEVHGESESGKSWLVLHVAAQELAAGHVVVYVDFEDDEGSVYRRLKLLGVSDEALLGDLFRYFRPNGPLTDTEKASFMASAKGADTVIFDGVTEGMALEGLSPRDEADVAAWHAKTTKDLAHAGSCVIVIDHTPHDGNRTIGSQHKKATISGVSYLVDPVQPIAAGQRGVLRLKVEKDRPGGIRREAAGGSRPQWRGDLVVDFSEGRTRPDVRLYPASPRDGERDDSNRPPVALLSRVIAFVAANDGCTKNSIRAKKLAGREAVDWALEWLVDRDHIRTEDGPRKSVLHHVGAPLDLGESTTEAD